MTQRNHNASPMVQAARDWITAKTKQTGGDALAMVGLAAVFRAPLEVTIDDKTQIRTLADYVGEDRRNPDGTARKGEKGAIRDAAIRAFFGVEGDIPNAVKAGFGRTVRAAAFIAEERLTFTLNKRNEVEGVPLGWASAAALFDGDKLTKAGEKAAKALAHAVKMANPALTADEALEAAVDQLDGTPVTVDGREHPMFGKLITPTQLAARLSALAVERSHCAAPAKRERIRADETDQGKAFSGALDMVSQVMGEWAQPDGESDVAYSDALVAKARKAHAALAAFLAAQEPSH